MPLVGGFVFPHGAITLDPDTRDLTKVPAYRPGVTKEACLALHAAMKAQAEILASLQPDIIIMTTPHGLRLQENFVVHGNHMSFGTAEWDGEWTEFAADIPIEQEISGKFVEAMRTKDHDMELLLIGAPTNQKLPLNWGEAIPWWFIARAYEAQGKGVPPPSVVIGLPTKFPRQVDKIPELVRFGQDVWTFIKTDLNTQRVAVVISCDLSHAHSNDPTSPYPFNPDAVPFDNLCVDWAKMSIDKGHVEDSNNILIKRAGPLTDHILSCGYTGLCVLQGVLTSGAEASGEFKGKFMNYSWPTYYGMMVNHFLAKE